MHDCASNRALDSLPSRFECLQVSRVFLRKYACNLSKKSPRLSTSKIVVLFLGSFKVRPGQEGQRGETIRIE